MKPIDEHIVFRTIVISLCAISIIVLFFITSRIQSDRKSDPYKCQCQQQEVEDDIKTDE